MLIGDVHCLEERRTGVDRFKLNIHGWSQLRNKITFIPRLKGHVLTPKFGKESDLWVQLGQEFVSWKGRIFQMYSAKKSAVGYLLPFGKETVELILRDWTVTWLKQGGRMNGYAIKLRDKLGNGSIRDCTWQGINMSPECM
jgi:hypothetical protein